MTFDGGFAATGYCRSPLSGRLYLVQNGFVVGEVPPEAEASVPGEQVREDLNGEAELEYLRRKTGNLARYKADLDAFRRPDLGASLPLHGAADFRIANLLLARLPRAPIFPRLVQLGNLGCFAYAHVGWRYMLRPAANELEILKQVPIPVLVADDGVPRFVQRESTEVVGEIHLARELAERIHSESTEGA